MKLNRLFIGIIAAAAIVLGCDEEEELGLPSIAVSSSSLSFDQAGGANNAQTLALLCTRDWVASCDADWVYVLPVSGQASTSAVEITIYVEPNDATNRTAKVTFTTSTVSTTISVSQEGPNGATMGEGTVDNPYTVSDALEIINNGEYTSSNVYVKGIISQIDDIDTGYGNATYYISDDGTTSNHLEIYRGYSLGGNRFTSTDEIKVGDEVIVCGELTLFYSTPEITTGSSIYSLNGSTSGSSSGDTGDLTGSGTASDPYTASDALAIINAGTYTSDNVYVKGIISQIDDIDISYGNATYYISDDGSTSNHLEVYRGYSLGGIRFTSTNEIKVGDEVIVCGQLTKFYSTPEITTGSSIYSLNGVTSGSSGGDTGDLTGSGTASDPYTASDALTIINAGTYTSNNVYVKGIISQIDEIDTGTYGNATYYISDDGTTSNHLEVYRGYSLGGNKFTSANEIKVGDEVIVYGVLTMFYSTPEITTGSSIYSLNGVVSNVGGEGEGGGSTEQGSDERYQTNVTWTVSSGNHSYNEEVVIDGETYSILKLGTSSATGSATCTVPAGTTAVTFYCIGWNGKGEAPFTITVGGNVFTASAIQNSGLANNSPYTITLSDSDYFEVPLDAPLASAATVTAETTSSSSSRVGIVGFKYVQ